MSGDRHLVAPFAEGLLVAVVDGLGHGEGAAEVAGLALETLGRNPEEPPERLIQRCHEALRGTRGAVMSVASFHQGSASMSWISVGNVLGALFLADPLASPRRHFLLRAAGVVGVRLPALLPAEVPVRPGDALLFATDGVRGEEIQDLPGALPAQRLAENLLARHQTGKDDALVLVARFNGVRS